MQKVTLQQYGFRPEIGCLLKFDFLKRQAIKLRGNGLTKMRETNGRTDARRD